MKEHQVDNRNDGRDGPTIVVFGNLIVDDIVYQDGRTRMGQAGGAVVHFALGAALWGVSVGIVSVVGEAYPSGVLDRLEERGIDLSAVRRLNGPGMRTWLLYENGRRQVLHRLSSPSHHLGSPSPEDLPSWWSPSVAHLAPMPLDRQQLLLTHLRQTTSATLSVDPYALFDESSWDSCVTALSETDILLASEDEILLADTVDQQALWKQSGIPLVLFKQGAKGGTIFDSTTSEIGHWAPRTGRVVDSTGAGDAFAGGLLAGLAGGDQLDEALQKAVVSAALTLECDGVDEMLDVSPDDATRRRLEWMTTWK